METKEESKWVVALVWGGAILLCLLIWTIGAFGTHWFAHHYFVVDTHENAPALFGDSFGAVNALISAFAFAGMIVTFWLQRKELKLQRDELASQRMEFAQQNETLKLQRFENTFFNMMQLQQQIVNDLQYSRIEGANKSARFGNRTAAQTTPLNKIYKGRELFSFLFSHKNDYFYDGIKYDLIDGGWLAYNESTWRTYLDHYFRHFYTILRFINETSAFDYNEQGNRDEEYEFAQKYHYATILRATLSRYELVLLFYNGLSVFGQEHLKPLLEKYSMLNNLNESLLTLINENRIICQIPEDAVPSEYLQEKGLSGTDYEFFITIEGDREHYNLNAFCTNKEEKEGLIELIRRKDEYLKSLK